MGDLRGGEQHRRTVRAGRHAGAAPDAGGSVERTVGIRLRDRDRVGLGRGAGRGGDVATRLDDAVQRLGIDAQCYGMTTDLDLAIKLETYFESPHKESRSVCPYPLHACITLTNLVVQGTAEFMSTSLLKGKHGEYLQSPMDDLDSFKSVYKPPK